MRSVEWIAMQLIVYEGSFEMPASAANGGYTFADVNSTVEVSYIGTSEYDDFDDAYSEYSVIGSSEFDSIIVEFGLWGGDEVRVRVIEYVKNGDAIWMLHVETENYLMTLDELKNGEVFEISINSDVGSFLGGDNRDVLYAGPGDDSVMGGSGTISCLATQEKTWSTADLA